MYFEGASCKVFFFDLVGIKITSKIPTRFLETLQDIYSTTNIQFSIEGRLA
jgi:hypothetical protein